MQSTSKFQILRWVLLSSFCLGLAGWLFVRYASRIAPVPAPSIGRIQPDPATPHPANQDERSMGAEPTTRLPHALQTKQVGASTPGILEEASITAQAVVSLAHHNQSVTLSPNELGLYPRVLVSKGETIPISVRYTDGEPGEGVVISAEDGGKINGDTPVKATQLNPDRTASFTFTTSQDEGVFRVTVRRGSEQTQFDFWVGPEPPLQTDPL